jgi:acetyl esterase/lipase
MNHLMRSVLMIAVVLSAVATQADENVEITPDVVYGHKLGMALTFDAYTPKDANGTGILFMVSGGWVSRWAPPEATMGWLKPMLDAGFTVFAVRHGSSPRFKVPEAVADVRRSVRYIRLNAKRFGVDPARLGVAGGSAGGHLSLMLGTTGDDGDPDAKDEVLRQSSRVAAVVAYFPPTDLRPWVGTGSKLAESFPALQFDPDLADDCSPLLHVTEDDAPALMIHGDKDTLVTLDHSEKILKEFEEQKVTAELIVIDGAGHGFRGKDNKRASDALVGWFKRHLLKE